MLEKLQNLSFTVVSCLWYLPFCLFRAWVWDHVIHPSSISWVHVIPEPWAVLPEKYSSFKGHMGRTSSSLISSSCFWSLSWFIGEVLLTQPPVSVRKQGEAIFNEKLRFLYQSFKAWIQASSLGWFNSRANASKHDYANVKCEMHSYSFFPPLLSPKGALTECYDELGNRYQLPVYCLAPPINMIEEKGDLETLDIPDPPPNSGHECQLRLRLSTGKDLKLMVRSMDTVYHMKRRLHAVEGVEPGSQRWFFSGRPLADKMKLEELKIPKDYVVQVIVSQPLANPTPVENWFLFLVYWFF